MSKLLRDIGLALRLWLLTSLVLSIGIIVFILAGNAPALLAIIVVPGCMIAAIPALLLLVVSMRLIAWSGGGVQSRIHKLIFLCAGICLVYGCFAGLVLPNLVPGISPAYGILICAAVLFACVIAAIALSFRQLNNYFSEHGEPTTHINSNTTYMETTNTDAPVNERSNKVLIKGIITGVLIMVMLIPTLFVNNLVKEREQRQKEIVQEVSSKWAGAQRVSGPYLYVPYAEHTVGSDGKLRTSTRQIVLLPENLSVNGRIIPEEAHRSIYHVLLYRANLQATGSFNITLPGDILPENVDFSKARICVGLSDYKGIEEKLTIVFNNTKYNLAAGLPTTEIDAAGVSAPVALTAADLGKPLAFNAALNLRGSSQLRFLPLSANSQYHINSLWPDPSFDGNSLPAHRSVNDSGFTARWNFNEANLPFGTVIREGGFKSDVSSFGVNMLQPADQYAKTLRSVKYAILFIGLTFALFFIVELMQQRPVHPVQYVLVGLALVIFYTLLLSISEFIAFDLAYAIAATATVLLIALYAKGHFQRWGVAALFAGVLGGLYGFIFILIRLEDTALLVGSIGLFLVLALVMYASRKINWYGYHPKTTV
jgi:inner membrane protein